MSLIPFGHSTRTSAFKKHELYNVTSRKQVIELGGSDNSPIKIIFTPILYTLNQKTSKELKRIIGYQKDNPEMKRHLKRLKKQYLNLSDDAKPLFLASLRAMYNQ